MTKVDQFESIFKSAARTSFVFTPVHVERVLVLTDLPPAEADAWTARAQRLLRVLVTKDGADVAWKTVGAGAFANVHDLLDLVRGEAPDLVVTYRSVQTEDWRWSTTLGRHVDVLAQEVPMPLLLLPHPRAEAEMRPPPPPFEARGTPCVMALTHHLAGDHRLVSWAAHLTLPDGRLLLAHVEDEHVFERYLEAIGRIPQIDTATAREAIRERLLKDPHDYIASCTAGLAEADVPLSVEERISMGRRVREVRRIVEEETVDLLVMHTKDEDQIAMHGLAYPLVVELRHVPILML